MSTKKLILVTIIKTSSSRTDVNFKTKFLLFHCYIVYSLDELDRNTT